MWSVLKLLLSTSISGLLHLSVWRRLVRDAELEITRVILRAA